MTKIKGLTISRSKYSLKKGEGTIAVLIYTGSGNPTEVLDYAVSEYTKGHSYHELIDANLDNPWMRVVLSNINDMEQVGFDTKIHKIN